MKTYTIQLSNNNRTVVKVRAHSISEAVNKFKYEHPDLARGWSLIARTHHCPQSSWQFKRHTVKEELKQCKDEINSVWRNHEEVKGRH